MAYIEIRKDDPMVNTTFKLPAALKGTIEKVAQKEGVSSGEIVRAFMSFALEAYRDGRVINVWGTQMMDHFRKQVRAGDNVIASLIFGKVLEIAKESFKMETTEGVVLKMHLEALTDIINPRKEIVEEMKRYETELKGEVKIRKKGGAKLGKVKK